MTSSEIFAANIRDVHGAYISFPDVILWGKEWFGPRTKAGTMGEYEFMIDPQSVNMVISEDESPEGETYNIFTVTTYYPFAHFACAMNNFIDRFSPKSFFWGDDKDAGRSESRPDLAEFLRVYPGVARTPGMALIWRKATHDYTEWHKRGGQL